MLGVLSKTQTFANPPPLVGNVITNPYDMANASWGTKYQLNAITSDATLAPDGSMNGDQVVPNTNADFHAIAQTGLTTTGRAWIARARFKMGWMHYVELIVGNNNSYTKQAACLFNMGAGVRVRDRNVTYTTHSRLQRLSNRWMLCDIVIHGVDANSTHRLDVNFYRDPGTASFAGDGASGMYFWGIEFAPVPN